MLKNFFISEVRINILKLFFSKPSESYHVRGIVRKVDAEINAVRRELKNLEEIGFLNKRQSSNRLYYSLNPDHPLYPDMLALISKEDGLGYEIIKNAENYGDIGFAMISKGFLKGRDSTVLDIDLFIVGAINMDEISALVKKYELQYGREINFSTMTREEFAFRKRTFDNFVMKVLAQSRVMLLGDEEKFCSLT